MKKTRNKVFETNSSSSHTLTIEDRTISPIMIENKILYINRIPRIETSNNTITIASTQFEKLAFIISCLKYSENEYLIAELLSLYNIDSFEGGYGVNDETEELTNKTFKELVKLIDGNLTLMDIYEEY